MKDGGAISLPPHVKTVDGGKVLVAAAEEARSRREGNGLDARLRLGEIAGMARRKLLTCVNSPYYNLRTGVFANLYASHFTYFGPSYIVAPLYFLTSLRQD